MGRTIVLRTARDADGVLAVALRERLDGLGRDVREIGSAEDPELSEAAPGDLDALIVLAPSMPTGAAATWSRSYRGVDAWLSHEVPRAATLARDAGCRRIVLQSSALLYAGAGSEPVDEGSPLSITATTEPLCTAELAVTSLAGPSRRAVVLRLAPVLEPGALAWLCAGAARADHEPEHDAGDGGWVSTVSAEAAADAVLRALRCPSGIYNVGAPAEIRHDVLESRCEGRVRAPRGHLPAARVEPFSRSVRLDSSLFTGATGWMADLATAARA